ncbi:hypothetical protein [Rurimicrobium arvi]|uniref:Uncharacterized protein n=1 Tax=Rurimicrobium arvi TaxID=2049916 RepID=A0ABP8MDG2_9BACT
MKKVFLSALAFVIAGSLVFVACKKDNTTTQSVKPQSTNSQNLMFTTQGDIQSIGTSIARTTISVASDPNLQAILATSYVTNALALEGFNINSSAVITTSVDQVTGNTVYSIPVETGITTLKAGLVIQPVNVPVGIYKVFIAKTSTAGVQTSQVKVIGDVYFDPSGMVGDAHWRGCMTAAWNDATSGLDGAIAAALFPEIVLAACLISCANAISVPSCVTTGSVPMTKAQALQCLCDLGLINCSATVSASTYTFVTPS